MFNAGKPRFHLDLLLILLWSPVIFLHHLMFGLSAPFYHLCEENGLQAWKKCNIICLKCVISLSRYMLNGLSVSLRGLGREEKADKCM